MNQEQGTEFFMDEMHKGEQMSDIRVDRVVDGMGFGEGTISHLDRAEEVGRETLQAVEDAITSGEMLVPISTDKTTGKMIDDDGCPDGRKWGRILQGTVEKAKSLFRPKVFGAGPAMAAASHIGLGQAKGDALQSVFSKGIDKLKDKLIDFGGHTDKHAHGENCGCGALDRALDVVKNVAKYRQQIADTIGALGFNSPLTENVLDNFTEYADEIDGQDYSGAKVMGEIIDSGKIVKELTDLHLEMYIILNDVRGYTVDQDKVRELSDGKVQVFVVDTWRMQDLAERLNEGESDDVKQAALISELAYSLGVAATLTKGDLPVYRISGQPVLANVA